MMAPDWTNSATDAIAFYRLGRTPHWAGSRWARWLSVLPRDAGDPTPAFHSGRRWPMKGNRKTDSDRAGAASNEVKTDAQRDRAHALDAQLEAHGRNDTAGE